MTTGRCGGHKLGERELAHAPPIHRHGSPQLIINDFHQ